MGFIWVWLAGAATLGLVFLCAEIRFRRLARRGLAGPALVGVAAPRLVAPYDFAERFTEEERGFIRRHEREHMARLDPVANLLLAVVQGMSWFNPLVHLAAGALRMDQELACDAQVVGGRAGERRLYGQALVKAQLSRSGWSRTGLSLACAWVPPGPHPLELRLAALACPPPSLRRGVIGAITVTALAVAAAAATWGLAPSAPVVMAAAQVSAGSP